MLTEDLKKRAAARQAMLKKNSSNSINQRKVARQDLLKKLSSEDFLEKRAEARRAFLSKPDDSLEDRANARRAYMQGGPGLNDPKTLGYPGELAYPRMEVPVGGDSRQWEQQWFEGAAQVSKQKHGPAGVELELKKKLQRASVQLNKLEKIAKESPLKARTAASKIANELNSIIVDMDKAGYLEEAQEADEVLEEIASFIANPLTKTAEEEESDKKPWEQEETEDEPEETSVPAVKSASVKVELLKLANVLDSKGYSEEAEELDQIVSEL